MKSTFDEHDNIMNSNLPLLLKEKVYNQCILPILSLLKKTWCLTKDLKGQLINKQREMKKNPEYNMER